MATRAVKANRRIQSLHSCFEDDHAAHCVTCTDEALMAYRLQKEQHLSAKQIASKSSLHILTSNYERRKTMNLPISGIWFPAGLHRNGWRGFLPREIQHEAVESVSSELSHGYRHGR